MSPRALRTLLICSLVLNIFVISGVVGVALTWQRTAAQRPLTAIGAGLGRPARLRQAAMQLSPEYRRELRQTLRRTIQSLQPMMADARTARQDAGALLAAPTLDRPKLEAAMARARAADIAIRTRIETEVAAFVAGLPPGERAKLSDALAGLPVRPIQAPFPGGQP